MQQALHVARDILSGKVTPIEGGTNIAWFGSGDCYDFLNEIDVVGEMAALGNQSNTGKFGRTMLRLRLSSPKRSDGDRETSVPT
jgi:hypothetical protein